MKISLEKGLVDKVRLSIKKHAMLAGKERILTGLSGGPDSVCLLFILHSIKDEFNLDLHAIYIDHGLRPDEIPAEIKFCGNLCAGMNIPFITKSVNVKSFAKEQGINKQEAARELRYKTFNEALWNISGNKISVAHTKDDQAETLLINLFRGSGAKGLSGIPPVRGNIIRPLIDVERKEIEAFFKNTNLQAPDSGLSFVIDSSNLKQDYHRNKLRLSLIPRIREFNPNIIGSLARTAEILREEDAFLELQVTKALMKLISRKTGLKIELFLSPMEYMDRVLLRRILRRAVFETKGLRRISFTHIEDMIELIRHGKSGDRIYLPENIRAIKHYSTFIITSEPAAKIGSYVLDVPSRIVISEAGLVIKSSLGERTEDYGNGRTMALLDMDKLKLPLTVRARANGDFFFPLGLGNRKKLQDFFVDQKVPRDERDRVPIVTSGDDIIWLAGYRMDDRFKVVGNTKNVVRLEIKPSNF